MNCSVLILALKKNVAFPDDLVKRLNGKPLLQHTLDCVARWLGKEHVWVLTDSEEVGVMARRYGVQSIRDPAFNLHSPQTLMKLRWQFRPLLRNSRDLMVLWPYTPGLQPELLESALRQHRQHQTALTVSVQQNRHRLFQPFMRSWQQALDETEQMHWQEVRGFMILPLKSLPHLKDLTVVPFEVSATLREIQSYADWWVCEGQLRRKRIVFRVIGNREVGMGHIYRALTLAHAIVDHELIFVCRQDDEAAVNKIAGLDYPVYVIEDGKVTQQLLELQPQLVINDCLDTEESEIRRLRAAGVRVINFEDLGTGAKAADWVVNELYEEPLQQGGHILWGMDYAFLREEFTAATPRDFSERPARLLVTFGGTDPGNLTLRVLQAVLPVCLRHRLHVDIVVGEGYGHLSQLQTFLDSCPPEAYTFTNATGVISRFMERCDLAICGNGRTVHELAHMHVPAIVISHHEREATHPFSRPENGFVHLGLFTQETAAQIADELERLLLDIGWRRQLWQNTRRFDFVANRQRILQLIHGVLEPA